MMRKFLIQALVHLTLLASAMANSDISYFSDYEIDEVFNDEAAREISVSEGFLLQVEVAVPSDPSTRNLRGDIDRKLQDDDVVDEKFDMVRSTRGDRASAKEGMRRNRGRGQGYRKNSPRIKLSRDDILGGDTRKRIIKNIDVLERTKNTKRRGIRSKKQLRKRKKRSSRRNLLSEGEETVPAQDGIVEQEFDEITIDLESDDGLLQLVGDYDDDDDEYIIVYVDEETGEEIDLVDMADVVELALSVETEFVEE